ncbi:MAG: DUF3126 family protein [Sphingomonadales bacterium]|nr:DUF3126 family protein [Sphingomonadales bacterium]
MDDREILKLQRYLNTLFGSHAVRVKRGPQKEAAEVEVDEEFVGTIYRDDEEGEVSYTFTMVILDVDLEKNGGIER